MKLAQKTQFLNLAGRVGKDFDTIGFPIFSSSVSNYNFACETDDDFTISSFLPYDGALKTEAILLNHNLPQAYAVGDLTPIPFWVRGVQYVVVPDKDMLATLPSVVKESRIYSRLNTYAEQRHLAYLASKKRQDYNDEHRSLLKRLIEDFSSSKYWISLYRDLLMVVSSKPEPVKNEVLQLGSDWIFKFAHKADAASILSFTQAFEHYTNDKSIARQMQQFAISSHLARRPSSYSKLRQRWETAISRSQRTQSYEQNFLKICRENPTLWSEKLISQALTEALTESNASALTSYLQFIDISHDVDLKLNELAQQVKNDAIDRTEWILKRCVNYDQIYGKEHPITKSHSKELVKYVVFINVVSAFLGNREVIDPINSKEAGIEPQLFAEISSWQR